MNRALLLVLLLHSAGSSASGWNDYSLDVAPGFSVYRMNSFDICLGTTSGGLLVCPDKYPGQVGPLVQYAVTERFVVTRHAGVRPHERNPSIPEGDPDKEFFFAVRRADQLVRGPFTRVDWERSGLPTLTTLDWITPKNPNFWLPLLSNLSFLAFVLFVQGWPVVLVLVMAAGLVWLYRRRARNRQNAA